MSTYDDPLTAFASAAAQEQTLFLSGNSSYNTYSSGNSSSNNGGDGSNKSPSISPSTSATVLALPASQQQYGMPQPVLVVEATRSNSQTIFYNPNPNPNQPLTTLNPAPNAPTAVAYGSAPYDQRPQSVNYQQQQTNSLRADTAQTSNPNPNPNPPPRPSAEFIISSMTAAFLSKCNTKPFDLSGMRETESCVIQLTAAGAWKPALQLLNNMCNIDDALRRSAAGKIPNMLKIKLECYYWLQDFDTLSSEASTILVREENTIEDGSTSPGSLCNKQMSPLSVSLLILLEEVRALTGGFKEAMEQLFRYKREFETSPNTIKNSVFWIWRIRQVIINVAVNKRKYWRLGLTMTSDMIDDLIKWGERFKDNEKMTRTITILKLVALCRLCRLYLQASNLSSALKALRYARAEFAKLKGVAVDAVNLMSMELDDYWDRYYALSHALLEFAENKFDTAHVLFERIIVHEVASKSNNVQSTNIVSMLDLLEDQGSSQDDLEVDLMTIEAMFCFDASLLCVAVNNYAICSLYLKRIADAVMKLEQLIFDDPASNLRDPIVFNLCTLYDLSCTPELSQNKKKVLYNVSLAYHINDPILKEKNFRFQVS